MGRLRFLSFLVMAWLTLVGASCLRGDRLYSFGFENQSNHPVNYDAHYVGSEPPAAMEGKLSPGESDGYVFIPSAQRNLPFYDHLEKVVFTKADECSIDVPADELRRWVEGPWGKWYVRLTEDRLRCPEASDSDD